MRACACCSEEGHYLVEENQKISDPPLAELADMKFGATAALYVGSG